MDNKPKKYFFDNNDFDEEVMRARMRAEDEARRRPSFSQEEMEASRQTGFAQGRSEGVRETMASLEAQMVELNGHIDQALKAFDAHEDARTRVFIDQATLISSQILAKAFPVLLERLSLPQIESFLDKILQEQIKKRHIKIFVPTRYAEPLNEKIAALASLAPHGNSWTVEPREALSSYQCEIEWDGGGATWNPEQVTTQALKTLLAHIPEALPENDLALLNENEDGQAIDESAENTHNDTDVATT